MGINDVKCRSSEFWSCSQVGYAENKPEILGQIEATSGRSGFNKVAVSGENSRRRNTPSPEQRQNSSVDGKVIDQLADEVEKEISYHKSQVSNLEGRLKELRKLSGELEEINNSD